VRERSWSDEELGFLFDHCEVVGGRVRGIVDDQGFRWTCEAIADVLGRTPTAVSHKRSRILLHDWQPTQSSDWSTDEDDILMETGNLTTSQVAKLLPGRTESAVAYRRNVLRSVHPHLSFLGNKGKNLSPFRIGRRPLVAKTCITCGLLLDASWFYFKQRKRQTQWSSDCRRCEQGRKVRSVTERRNSRAAADRLQAITLPHAVNKMKEWTASEDELLADPDLRAIEKALRLGRTYLAVRKRMHDIGLTMPIDMGDPRDDVWLIDAPNAQRVLEAAS
jgi:hypothetical protein